MIIKTGEIIITIVALFVRINFAYIYSTGNHDSDICGHWNGRRHFLELGDRGELHAKSLTSSYARVVILYEIS